MNMTRRSWIKRSLATVVLLAAFGAASAVTLSEAVEQFRRQTNGRILKAETVNEGGRIMHVIRVLTPDGRVKVFRIPQD